MKKREGGGRGQNKIVYTEYIEYRMIVIKYLQEDKYT